MKKTLICLLVVALFASLFTGITHASSEIPVAFALTSAQGSVGDVVSIDVLVSANSDVGALGLQIFVPTEYLDLATVENNRGKQVYSTPGPVLTENGGQHAYSDAFLELENGRKGTKISAVAIDGFGDEDVVCTVYFKIIKKLPTQGVALELKVNEITNCIDKYVEYEVGCVNGYVVPTGTPVPAAPDFSDVSQFPELKPLPKPTPTPTPQPNLPKKSVALGIGSAKGAVGESVAIDILISGESEIGGLGLEISFPTEYLAVSSVLNNKNRHEYITGGSVLTECDAVYVSTEQPQRLSDGSYGIMAAMVTDFGLWEGGVLATVYFRILKELPTDGVPLVCHVLTALHYDNQYTYEVTISDGRVVPMGASLPAQPDIDKTYTPRTKPQRPNSPVEIDPIINSNSTTRFPDNVIACPDVEEDTAQTDHPKEAVPAAKQEVEQQSTNEKADIQPTTPTVEIDSIEGMATTQTDPIEGMVTTQTDVATPDVLDNTAESLQSVGAANQASSDGGPTDDTSKPFILWLVVAAVALLGGGALVVLLHRKKKRMK